MKYNHLHISLISTLLTTLTLQASDADLAQELTNPIANLITIPIQTTYDQNIGPQDKGTQWQTNIQPVIPFDLGGEWNLITRTIIPVVKRDTVLPTAFSRFGLGDSSVSLFLSPKKSTDGLIWGAGPIILVPTATDSIGSKKWGVGPAGVLVSMRGPWTMGGLTNHVWSIAGSGSHNISNTFIQPFAAYTWPNAWTVSLQSESTYNWKAEEWAVPVNIAVSKLVRFGKLPVSLQAGTGYWMKSATNGPEGVRLRVQANFVLPKF